MGNKKKKKNKSEEKVGAEIVDLGMSDGKDTDNAIISDGDLETDRASERTEAGQVSESPETDRKSEDSENNWASESTEADRASESLETNQVSESSETGMVSGGLEEDQASDSAENSTVLIDGSEASPVSEWENPAITDTKAKKQKRPKKDKFDIKKDIWYRGPLSYRHLKILGWICLVISQVAFVLSIGDRMGMHVDIGFLSNTTVTSGISDMALPLILVSVFAFLLSKRENYKEAIILYAVLAIGVAGLFLLFYYHFVLGLMQPVSSLDLPLSIEMPGKEHAEEFLTSYLFNATGFKGFIKFNIFIDLFLCTLVMFFMDYTPKRFFKGKKIIIFRSLVVIPLLYEVACIFIKIMTLNHLMEIPLWISPFLTTKPPVSMIMFFSIVRYIKMQEKKYLKTGRTLEEYKEYCKTNVHSFRFSRHLILVILVYTILDILLVLFFAGVHLVLVDGVFETENLILENYANAINIVRGWGLGETADMILLIPIVLLFSYSRTHKVKVIDTIIPLVGVALIVLVYFEGLFQLLQNWIDYGLYEARLWVENNPEIAGPVWESINIIFQMHKSPR